LKNRVPFKEVSARDIVRNSRETGVPVIDDKRIG